MEKIRVSLAQIDPVVGDFEGNASKITEYIKKAVENDADIVCFPELAVCGYPPEDYLFKPKFIEDNLAALEKIARHSMGITVITGFVDIIGGDIFNSAALINNGVVCGVYHKMFLPNYGVFDEKRYFKQGETPFLFDLNGVKFGINICEDIWHDDGPTQKQAEAGAEVIFNLSASPYHMGKISEREEITCRQAKNNKVTVALVNIVGGQDELVFDGGSMLIDSNGILSAQAGTFMEELLTCDIQIDKQPNITPAKQTISLGNSRPFDRRRCSIKPAGIAKKRESADEVYSALELGLKDYVTKNGFKKVLVGLSGGIDSSIVAAIAADALGRENVTGIYMPTRYSSAESERNVKELALYLSIDLKMISIEQIYKIYLVILEPYFIGRRRDITEENLQARIRANVLMAFSNKFNMLLLTTGNKSEISTGYATLYGDMAGGLAVIKDVPKTLVYRLAQYRNSISKVIPEHVLVREPTAELRMNQKDEDTLPVYETLDPILKAYVEDDKNIDEISSMGFEREIISKVIHMVDGSEFKRRQSAPGIKITPKAFGRDRRIPVTNRYKSQ